MTIEDLLRQYYGTLWTQWNMDVVETLLTDTATWKTAFYAAETSGADSLYGHMGDLKAGFNDLRAEVLQVTSDGDSANAEVRWTGTHNGHIWGVEATGRVVEIDTTVEAATTAGKLSRAVESFDWLEARAQIAANPPQELDIALPLVVPDLPISDWDVTRKFYCGQLGFRVLFEHRFGCDFPVYAGIEREGAILHLNEHADTPGGMSLLLNLQEDIDRYHSSLVEGGMPDLDGPEVQPWGDRSFEVADPDGNVLTFSTPA